MTITKVRPEAESSLGPGGFRADIQGLRAVAVIAVILDHLFGWPAGGFVGVDVFFVISGFLITGLMLREFQQTGAISWSGFYRRRARRILPASTVVLVLTVAASFFVFFRARFDSIAGRRDLVLLLHVQLAFCGGGHRLPAIDGAGLAAAALLVAGRRGAVLCGVAGAADRGAGVRLRSTASTRKVSGNRARRRDRRHCAGVVGIFDVGDGGSADLGVFLDVLPGLGTRRRSGDRDRVGAPRQRCRCGRGPRCRGSACWASWRVAC